MKTSRVLTAAIPGVAVIAAAVIFATAGGSVATAASSASSTKSYRSAGCFTTQLRASIVEDGGGAAGSDEVAIQFTNVGKVACTLQGWPGVSFVGDGNGTQLGAAAQQNRSSLHATVTIGVGKTAIAPLRVTEALNFPTNDCVPAASDGFRVYPPGEKYSLFVKDADFTACTKSKDIILTISAVRPSN